MKPKEYFSKWKKGMMEMTPIQLAHTEVVGHTGTLIGIVFAWLVMFMQGMWYFTILMFFAFLLSGVAWISAKQKHKAMVTVQRQIEDAYIEDLKRKGEENNV